jgi:hypothetical protein
VQLKRVLAGDYLTDEFVLGAEVAALGSRAVDVVKGYNEGKDGHVTLNVSGAPSTARWRPSA